MRLSARALGILVYCVSTGTNPTVSELSGQFKEGREALRTALTELADEGLLERKIWRIGNRMATQCSLNDAAKDYLKMAGFWVPENEPRWRVSGELFPLNELTNTSSIVAKTSKEYVGDAHEEYRKVEVNLDELEVDMPYEFFEPTATDEALEARQEALQKKKAEYRDAKAQVNKKRIVRRQDVPTALWTCSDVAYEFADRLGVHWNISPLAVMSTRFIPALSDKRSRFDTNGEIEVKMMDLFFSTVEFEKYTDAEPLWKMFVKQFEKYASQAKTMTRTDEELEEASIQAKKSQEWLNE